jgi:hypothetical protein
VPNKLHASKNWIGLLRVKISSPTPVAHKFVSSSKGRALLLAFPISLAINHHHHAFGG